MLQYPGQTTSGPSNLVPKNARSNSTSELFLFQEGFLFNLPQVYVDDLESEDASPQDDFMDSNVVATAPRPGTSLKTTNTAAPTKSLG